MKALLDTSVLVAAIVPQHPFHAAALPWMERGKQGIYEMVVSAHSLAETYSTLTQLPLAPLITPHAAWQFIDDNILSCARIVALSGDDYREAVDAASQAGHVGGIIYDALIAKAAELTSVDYLVTFNVKDFQRVSSGASYQIVSPQTVAPP